MTDRRYGLNRKQKAPFGGFSQRSAASRCRSRAFILKWLPVICALQAHFQRQHSGFNVEEAPGGGQPSVISS